MTATGSRSAGSTSRQYQKSSTPFHFRTREESSRFFDGFELVQPGVVWLPE
jgi:hypothetical protein